MKPVLLFVCLLASGIVSAQDLIVKKDGSRFYGLVIRFDSSSIVYRTNNVAAELRLNTREVRSVYLDYDTTEKVTTKPLLDYKTPVQQGEMLRLMLYCGVLQPLNVLAESKKGQVVYAKTGFSTGGSAVFKFTKRLGIRADVQYQHLPGNGSVVFANPSYISFGYFMPTTNVDAANWTSIGFYIGPHLSFGAKTSPRLFFDLDILAGLSRYSWANELVTAQAVPGRYDYYFSTATSTQAFSAMGGFGLHYNFKKALTLNMSSQFFIANPFFSDIRTTYTNSNNASYSSTSVYQMKLLFRTLGVYFGFGYRIGG